MNKITLNVLLLLVLVGCTTYAPPENQDLIQQTAVSMHGSEVMPFDLGKTTHIFYPVKMGGFQIILADSMQDQAQVLLIQSHLQQEAAKFAAGNFEDPEHIHGANMPGLAEMEAHIGEIELQYIPLHQGGEIIYQATTEEALNAIHSWFAAQLAHHGADATDIPPWANFEAEQIALGKMVYDASCAECHGVNLEGEPNWKEKNEDGSFRGPPHDETGHTWHHPDSELLTAIELGGGRLSQAGGTSKMPAFATELSSAEIKAVLQFIKSEWPADIQLQHWHQGMMQQ